MPAVEEIGRMFVGFSDFRKIQKQESNYHCIHFIDIYHLENIYPLCLLSKKLLCRILLGISNFGKGQKQQQSETSFSVYL